MSNEELRKKFLNVGDKVLNKTIANNYQEKASVTSRPISSKPISSKPISSKPISNESEEASTKDMIIGAIFILLIVGGLSFIFLSTKWAYIVTGITAGLFLLIIISDINNND